MSYDSKILDFWKKNNTYKLTRLNLIVIILHVLSLIIIILPPSSSIVYIGGGHLDRNNVWKMSKVRWKVGKWWNLSIFNNRFEIVEEIVGVIVVFIVKYDIVEEDSGCNDGNNLLLFLVT